MKIFARAIHCLARMGLEIYVEPLEKGLSLRSVNTTRSAYACFIFQTSFFQTYDDGNSDDESSDEGLKCKLSARSLLSVFKSLSTIERMVDRCSIKMNDDEEQITFILRCLHGVTKTYNLSYQDCESLEAVYSKNLSPNMINIQPEILCDIVTNFPNALDEITLTVCPQNMVVTNYVEEYEDPAQVINTKIELVAEEFEKFQIGFDTEITFCLKELKGISTFADSISQNVDLHFESGGKPIVFSLTNDPTFEANFVLATLVDLPRTQGSQQTNKTNNKSEKGSEPSKKQSKSLSREASEPEDGQSTSQAHSQHTLDLEDGFGFDGDEEWANEVLSSAKEHIVQEPLTKNNGNRHPDFDNSFQFKELLSKKGSILSQPRRTAVSGKCMQSPPQRVPSDLEFAEMPGSMSVDSEKSPGNSSKTTPRET